MRLWIDTDVGSDVDDAIAMWASSQRERRETEETLRASFASTGNRSFPPPRKQRTFGWYATLVGRGRAGGPSAPPRPRILTSMVEPFSTPQLASAASPSSRLPR